MSGPSLPAIGGVSLRTYAAGLRYHGRPDLLAATFEAPAAVAGVFTRSACPSAAVEWDRARVAPGRAGNVCEVNRWGGAGPGWDGMERKGMRR